MKEEPVTERDNHAADVCNGRANPGALSLHADLRETSWDRSFTLRGSIVIRVDARCQLQPDHVSRIIDRLGDPAIGSVGGAALVLDRGVFGSAL